MLPKVVDSPIKHSYGHLYAEESQTNAHFGVGKKKERSLVASGFKVSKPKWLFDVKSP